MLVLRSSAAASMGDADGCFALREVLGLDFLVGRSMPCNRIRLAAALASPLARGCCSARGSARMSFATFLSAPPAAGDSLALDLYVPEQGTTSLNTTIIIIHGGSYNSGCRCDFDALSTALADLGFTVVSPDYTLVTPTSASYPQPISDIFNALHWVRTEGETIGLPNKVIICGVSAGSTIGMTAAAAASTNVFNRLPDPINRGYTVDGAIGVMGRYDLVWNANFGIPQTVMSYIGVPFSNPNWGQTWSQASAITYANANSPPTFLIHGTSDGLVPYFNSTRLNQRFLVDVGAPVLLALVPGLGHDMSILGFTAPQQAQTIAAAPSLDRFQGKPALRSSSVKCTDRTVTTQASCPWTFSSGRACSPESLSTAGIDRCVLPLLRRVRLIEARMTATTSGTAVFFCSPNPCPPPPPPLGSCCAQSGLCSFTPQSFCQSDWTANVFCQPNPCQQPPPRPRRWALLRALGRVPFHHRRGLWHGLDLRRESCQPNPASSPRPPAGLRAPWARPALTLESDCTGPNRRFTSNQTACNVAASTTPCCRGDFNQNDAIAVSDIFDYLSSWFASSHDCCISSSPSSTPVVQLRGNFE